MIASNTAPASPNPARALNLLKMPPECWRPFEFDGARRSDRIGEREIEKLETSIRCEMHSGWIPVKIRDYSLTGFGIHYKQTSGILFKSLAGEKVELKIVGPWNREILVPCEIRNTTLMGEGWRIGLERLDLGQPDDPPREGAEEYNLDPASQLLVRIANPVLYHEWGEATLTGFGLGNEWIFESNDVGLLLLKNVPLRIFFDLPLETNGESQADILWTRAMSGNRVAFGVRWVDLSFQISNAVGEHLLLAAACKPSDLRRFGVHLRRFKEQLRFAYISTMEEYGQVLELRRNAYLYSGKIASATTPAQLASSCDGHSRILAAFHGESMAASVGLTFAKNESSPLRSEGEFPDGCYPVPVPPKHSMIEVHSLCTHNEYRGGDLIRGMFEHIARTLLLSERDWLITFATADLWPLYRKIGFRKAGASVPIKSLGGIEHHLILLHRNSLIHGNNMTPFAWNYFFGELIRDLRTKRYIEVPWHKRLIIAAYSLFGGLTDRRAETRLENDFQAFLDRGSVKENKHD